jgi:hypothetical protein
MLFLTRDVLPHRLPSCGTDGEGSVTLLPRERPTADLLMYPHQVRQAVGSLQPDQEMHMLHDSANLLWKSTQPPNASAKVVVETGAPGVFDERPLSYLSLHYHLIFSTQDRALMADKPPASTECGSHSVPLFQIFEEISVGASLLGRSFGLFQPGDQVGEVLDQSVHAIPLRTFNQDLLLERIVEIEH